MRLLLFGCALAVALLSAAESVEARWVWTRETGWYNPDDAVPTTAPELLQLSRQAFDEEDYEAAARGYRLLIDLFPKAPERVQAFAPMLEAQILAQDYESALTTIDQILREDLDSTLVASAVRKKYEIGYNYLTGTQRYFIGIPYSGEPYGVEILDGLVERYPFEEYSDDALFHVGGYYFRKARYQEAELIYERLIRDYPKSEWAGIAEYQIGNSALHRLKGVEYDFSPVDTAERRLRRYLLRFAGGDKATEARAALKEIDELRAERLLGIANFYLREGRADSALYYLRRIRSHHPETRVIERVRKLLKEIEPSREGNRDGG